jgi:hypothetical protein
MNKKAQGMIIAWVLLIGLTVSLAVIVTTWTRQQAEDTVEGIASGTEVDLRCSAVSFNAQPLCDTETIKIVNRGDFSIHKFVIHMKNAEGLKSKTVNLFEEPHEVLIPGKTQTINTNLGDMYGEIDLTPFIKVEDQIVGCSDRKLTVKCEV